MKALSFVFGLSFGLLNSLPNFLSAQTLSLEDYLKQVKENHQGYAGSLLASTGAELRSRDSSLVLWPMLSGLAQFSKDDKDDLLTSLDQQTRHTFNLGVSEQTPFGLQAKFSYNMNYISFESLSGGTRPAQKYYEGRPQLDLSQALWRNGFGSELRAGVRAAEAAARSVSFMESYRGRVILSQAESVYWNLSVAKEFVSIQSDVLKRAQDLYAWAKNRVELQLSDKSDRLQAEALLRLRELELKNAKDQERSAARAFNEFRGQNSDDVSESLASLDSAKIVIPQRAELRDDTKAAREQQIATQANARLGREKTRPVVDVFGSLGLNGSRMGASDAFSESFKTDEPYLLGGLRISVPLNFGLAAKVKEGYQKEEVAAQKNFERKIFEQESQWANLLQRLDEAKERFELTKILEKVQKEKLKTEKERLNRARTTTFQVIQFELDNAQAQIARLKSHADILAIVAEMKTYGGDL